MSFEDFTEQEKILALSISLKKMIVDREELKDIVNNLNEEVRRFDVLILTVEDLLESKADADEIIDTIVSISQAETAKMMGNVQ